MPAEHNPLVGADIEYCPCAGPHWPFTVRLAEQLTLLPPLIPLQFQSNGPDPDTLDAVPAEQSPEDGAEVVPTPFALPHAPLILRGAEQDALVPPPDPLQAQPQGPDPETDVAVPVEQRFDDGADVTPTPSALPQAPLMAGHRSALTGA